MKKAFITLCVIMMTTVAFAGGGKEKPRYYAPKFTQGWFIDVAGTYSIYAGTKCKYVNPTTYYGWGGTQFGYSAKIGKRVGPNTAVRLGYDWHKSSNENGPFNFMSIHVDVMESLIDLFAGYNPERFFTLWMYGGFGVLDCGRADQYFFGFKDNLEYGFHGGFMNNFRLSNSLDFHIDLTAVSTKWSFDSQYYETNSLWHRSHFDFTAMAGIMWYIGGRSFEKVEQTGADYTEYDNRIKDLNDQVNSLQEQLANAGQGGVAVHDTIVKTITVNGEVITYPFSVFFNKGSYELRDGRDRINLQEIAQAAINHNLKVTLKGTCDAATASAAFNKTLAENRCNKVKAELVKIGVPAENITIQAVGGVNELKPAEYDRRVIVQFSEK